MQHMMQINVPAAHIHTCTREQHSKMIELDAGSAEVPSIYWANHAAPDELCKVTQLITKSATPHS
jgi:hypothetical protein